MTASELSKNVRWGVEGGVVVAAFYSLVFCVVYALGMSGGHGDRRIGFLPGILGYFASGVIAGAVVGLLRPLAKTRAGAVCVAIVAALPAALVAGTVMYGSFDGWTPGHWIGLAVFGGVMGALFGWVFSSPEPGQ